MRRVYTSSLRRKGEQENEEAVMYNTTRKDLPSSSLLVAEYARKGVTVSLACYGSAGFMP
jgi:hypothetical protein